MCGIVGYIGDKPAVDILIDGLQRLEYRGYDSAGVAIVNGGLSVEKKQGKVKGLSDTINRGELTGTLGVGHTRWATHGAPNDVNAHPHTNANRKFAIVHNGIIENFASLKERLITKGYTFESDTDTEVLAHLIDDIQKTTMLPIDEAVRQALTQVVGTYGLAMVSADDPNTLIAARKGSPLIIGVGDNEYFLGSDAAPLIEHTRQVVYLNDGEMAVITREGYQVRSIDNVPLEKEVHELEWDLEQIEKHGYDHFMFKEIMEQPESLENCMRGRVRVQDNDIHLGGLIDSLDTLLSCTTNHLSVRVVHRGMLRWSESILLKDSPRIPVEVEYASEFRYRNPILTQKVMSSS